MVLTELEQGYLELMQSLLPEGPAWNKSFETYNEDGSVATPHSNLTLMLGAMAKEYARIHTRALDLIKEANPLYTYETIYKKYEEAGLPDDCSGFATSVEQMRLEILQRWSSVGGASVQFLADLLTASGYTFTIKEYIDQMRVGMPCQHFVASSGWANSLTITITGVNETWFRANTGAGNYLHEWENNSVFCYIEKIKPAHVYINYVFP